jgi:hypothetical protein
MHTRPANSPFNRSTTKAARRRSVLTSEGDEMNRRITGSVMLDPWPGRFSAASPRVRRDRGLTRCCNHGPICLALASTNASSGRALTTPFAALHRAMDAIRGVTKR